MRKVLAGITTSLRGRLHHRARRWPCCELGIGGERLHYRVFGGPPSYDPPGRGEPAGEDKAWLEETMRANVAEIAGRGTYASSEVASERSPGVHSDLEVLDMQRSASGAV